MVNAFDEMVDDAAEQAAANVPALHILFTVPIAKAGFETGAVPTAAEELAALRSELVQYVAGGLGGDVDAAEWVILALLARM